MQHMSLVQHKIGHSFESIQYYITFIMSTKTKCDGTEIPFKELKQQCYSFQNRDANNAITNQAAIDLWNQQDITIRNSILISIDPSQKQNLYGLPTAREMWLKISTLFAAQADEIEQQLITRIFNYQHNPGTFEPQDLSIGKIQTICSSLNQIQERISDTTLITS